MKKQKPKQKILSKRLKIYLKYDGRCAYCGKVLDIHQMTVDHVVPQSMGGSSRIDNLLPSCSECNTEKGSLTLHLYRKEKVWQSLTVENLRKMMKSYTIFHTMFAQKVNSHRFYFENFPTQGKK